MVEVDHCIVPVFKFNFMIFECGYVGVKIKTPFIWVSFKDLLFTSKIIKKTTKKGNKYLYMYLLKYYKKTLYQIVIDLTLLDLYDPMDNFHPCLIKK